MESVNVLIEAVYDSEDSEQVKGYNVFNEDNDETIGFISLQEDGWHCDSDTTKVFDIEDFDSALKFSVDNYAKESDGN